MNELSVDHLLGIKSLKLDDFKLIFETVTMEIIFFKSLKLQPYKKYGRAAQ